MAVLSGQDRILVAVQVAQGLSSSREPCGLNKVQFRAAIDAADAWADANAAAYNSALPPAARTTLTVAQKARILAFVLRKRWEVG